MLDATPTQQRSLHRKGDGTTVPDEEVFLERVRQLQAMKLLPKVFKSPMLAAWEMTARCNQRCIHCFNDSGAERSLRDLPDDALWRIANELIHLEVIGVCLTGGEAMLRGEVFFRVAAILRDAGVMLGTVTNGMMVSSAVARRLTGLFSRVQVSVDGSCAKTHDYIRGCAGAFDQVLRAIDSLGTSGVKVAVAFSLCDRNNNELEDFIGRMLGFGCVDMVRITPLCPVGRGHGCDLRPPTPEEWNKALSIVERVRQSIPTDRTIQCIDPAAHIAVMRDERVPNYFAEITHDGHLRGSPYVPVVFGDLRHESLECVWKNSGIARFWTLEVVRTWTAEVARATDFGRGGTVAWVNDTRA